MHLTFMEIKADLVFMNTKMRSLLIPCIICSLFSSVLTAASGEWEELFDGETLNGWHGYKGLDASTRWAVEDGILHVKAMEAHGKSKKVPVVDLVSDKSYSNFELRLEWKCAEAANSGVFMRANEEGAKIWHSAMEIQILDGAGFAKLKEKEVDAFHDAGAAYGLYATDKDSIKPVGKWNKLRVLADGKNISVKQNGKELYGFTVGSEDWKKRFEASKFRKYPMSGQYETGHIGLQDHGGGVWFRKIQIRER